tara:strand:+ start:12644 stop:12895 length:252 start_codon:yes stop_codon:yes gene_type:complete
MAVIEKEGKQVELQDGEAIRDACEKLDILFACKEGYCGTCMITIQEGAENLTELTNEEKMLDRDMQHRLACQAKIKQGIIIIE